jgi:hypothetical protein
MQQIIRHLFQVDTLEEVPRERLEELVGSYPSFGVGRYLLSRKLRTENAGHFSEETQKTNLYFSNPFWLQWLLQNEAEEQKPAYTRTAPPVYTPVEEPVIDEETALITIQEEPPVAAAEAPAAPEKPEMTNGPVIVEEPGAAEELPSAPLSASESLLQSLAEARELRQSLVQMNQVDDQTIPIPEESPEELIDEELAPDYEAADFEKAREAIAGRIAAAASEASGMQFSASAESPVQPSSESVSESVVLLSSEGASGLPVIQSSEAPLESPAVPATETPEAAASASQSGSGTSVSPEAPTAIVSHATALAEPIVMFEPYHTIDYFASVGIKFVQDENPSDKLGKQLKSFTEWLKVMRKLPQKNQEIVPDVAAEHQIQAIAAHSIKGKEILTETMAEVLVKQGMREKAVEVYHKLSLLNPDKSAYFATKIEQLKID